MLVSNPVVSEVIDEVIPTPERKVITLHHLMNLFRRNLGRTSGVTLVATRERHDTAAGKIHIGSRERTETALHARVLFLRRSGRRWHLRHRLLWLRRCFTRQKRELFCHHIVRWRRLITTASTNLVSHLLNHQRVLKRHETSFCCHLCTGRNFLWWYALHRTKPSATPVTKQG